MVGNILVVLLVDDVADIGSGDVQFPFGLHFDRLGHSANSQSDVFADRLCALQLDPRIDGFLKSRVIDADRVRPQRKRRRGERARTVGGQCRFERAVPSLRHFDFGPCER